MLQEQLRRHMDGEAAAPAVPAALALHAEPGVERIDQERGDSDYWHISLRFGRGVLQNGMDPIAFLRYLSKLGRIVGIATMPDALPPADEMDAELCYLGFEIAFDSRPTARRLPACSSSCRTTAKSASSRRTARCPST
jgi:two-component system chemotaxis sensor kinase CheA